MLKSRSMGVAAVSFGSVVTRAALVWALGLAIVGSASTAAQAVCFPSSTTLCLLNNRFAATLQWNDGSAAGLRPAFVAGPKTDSAGSSSGLFYFFQSDPDNWEILVKLLNACGGNPARFWVLVSASTGFQFVLTITDTETNAVEIYSKPLNGQAGGVADFSAFPGSCIPFPPQSAQVRYLNNLTCNSSGFTSTLSANGFQWVSFSGTSSAYQAVNRTFLGPFSETNNSPCPNENYQGTLNLTPGRRYALVQTLQSGNRFLAFFDEGPVQTVGDASSEVFSEEFVDGIAADKGDERLGTCDELRE